MISDRADYDFVTIPSSIKINGEIMPLRANKNELRGEDPAFLMEAQAERNAVWDNFDSVKYVMTKEIRADRLGSVAENIRDDVTRGRFIRPWPSGPVYDISGDLVSDLHLAYTESDLVSSPEDFLRGHPLVQADVGKLFTDTDLLRTVNINKDYMDGVSITYTYAHGEDGDEFAATWNAYSPTLYLYSCSCREERGGNWIAQWREAVAGGGTVAFDIGSVRARYIRPVTSAWAVCSVWDSWVDDGSGGGRSGQAAFRASASMIGSSVTVSVGSLAAGAKSLLGHYGFEKRYKKIEGQQTASVSLEAIIPIVEMGDRCRW